ncbi:MAG: PleD family two-component system response regulator [Candidatus Odinarchaeota archaeon]
MKVLIIEDSQDEIDLIRFHLEEAAVNIKLDEALTGNEGLKLFKENDEYKVVILDYLLPDIDGFELLLLLLYHRNIPVIMITAAGSEEAAVKAIKLGAFDYIPKTGYHYLSIINTMNKIASFPLFELSKCPLSIFSASEKGPKLVYSDTLPWGSKNESILTKAGIFFSAALGQGTSYHQGIFGPLPVADVPDHSAIIYCKILEDKLAEDPRRKTATYTLFCIFYPNESQVFFLDRFRLKEIFDDSLKRTMDVTELPGVIPELKNTLASRLGEYNPIFNRFF